MHHLFLKSLLAFFITGPVNFVRNTFKEMIFATGLMWLVWRGFVAVHKADPTTALPPAEVVLTLGWYFVKVYVAGAFGHGLLRLNAPTIADWVDNGGFRETWEKLVTVPNNSSFLSNNNWAATFTIKTALWTCMAHYAVALLAVFLAP